MQISLQQKNMKPKLILVAILAAYAMPQMVMAENKAETIELGKVEVVGVTPLSSLGVPIDQVPSNVQVAKGKDIQNQQGLSIADYMNQNMAGVNVNETQNNPYQPDVNFRGFTASPLVGTPQGLSVYQDGVRVNEPFGDTVNWDLIPQNAISSIALMPGSNPLFGLNTLGGAVSVQTKSGEHNPGGGVQVSGGSWGRWAVEGEYGGKLDNGVSYFFAGNKFEESGWRDSSPSDVLQGFGKLGWSDEKTDVDISFTGADNELTGNGYQAESLMQSLGRESIYTKPDITKNKLAFVNAKVSHWLSDELLLTTNAYYRHNRSSSYNGDLNGDFCNAACDAAAVVADNAAGGTAVAGDFLNVNQGVINQGHVTQKGYGLGAQLTWVTEKNQLIGGMSADLSRINFDQTSQLFSTFDAGRGVGGTLGAESLDVSLKGRSRTWSVFATDTYSVTTKLALTASGRYNNTRINNDDLLIPIGGVGTGSLTGSDTYSRFNPAVGLTYNVVPELNVYAGYNEGNRAPSIIELGCADSSVPCLLPNAMAGDPPLKQVVAKTFEGGVRGKFSDIAKWSLSAYRATNYDDLQFRNVGTAGFGFFDNVGKTRRQGIDLGLNGVAGDFSWSAGYSYIKATYESSFDIASDVNSSNVGGVITVNPGDNIPGIPKHQLKLRGEWRALPTWTIGATAVFFSDQYARGNENNQHQADGVNYLGSGKVGGYGVLNLDTRYTLPNSGWQLFAKVNNVFDRDYYTGGLLGANGFDATGAFANGTNTALSESFLAPGAPRAGWVGVRYDFGKPKSSASAVDVD